MPETPRWNRTAVRYGARRTTMWIHLLRHGIAEEGRAGQPDAERALTDEGWKRLRRAATAWRRLVEPPQIVWASPLRRAQETARAFAEAVRFDGDLHTERALLPDAPPALAVQLLEAELHSGTQRVAMVGHEPHLGYLLGQLLVGHPRSPIPLKKGMLVALETESTTSLVAGLRWSLTQRAAGELG